MEWREELTWIENGAEQRAAFRATWREEGKKRHVLIHRLNPADGRLQRLGKLEVDTGKWRCRAGKGWSCTGLVKVPSREMLAVVKNFASRCAAAAQ